MKLISMTDFVLEQFHQLPELPKEQHMTKAYMSCLNYAQFLKQPLTLGMFVPCDEVGNVLVSFEDRYEESKERVLFEFFEVIHIDKVRITIQHEFQQLDYNRIRERFEHYNTIEDLTGCHLDLTLTPQGIKQIGL